MGWTNDNGMLVSEPMTTEEAKALVAKLTSEGREASWAPDAEDRSIAYVWLTPRDA